jgi:hypothetical protein
MFKHNAGITLKQTGLQCIRPEQQVNGFIKDHDIPSMILNPSNPLEPNSLLPPCSGGEQSEGATGMGVEQWGIQVSTPSLALPLQGGGNIVANGLSVLISIPTG